MNSGFSRRRGVVLATLAVTSLGMGFACAPATFAADSDIVINEVTTQGRDAIELANKGAQDIDIAGWTIFDSDDGKGNKPIVFPAGTIIPAGGYFVFYPDSKEGGIAPDGSAGFGLDGNDSLELKNASGKRIDFQSWTSDPVYGKVDTSWSRIPDMTGEMVAAPRTTLGGSNYGELKNGTKVAADSVVKINEVNSQGKPQDWVELINTSDKAVDISGWRVLDNDDTSEVIEFPAGTTIEPGDIFTFETQGTNVPGGGKGFGLGKGDSVRLFNSNGLLVDITSWPAGTHADPWGRNPDGTGEFGTLTKSSRGEYNVAKPNTSGPATTQPSSKSGNVVINEVATKDVIDDWVELYNMGDTPVDISGWKLTDSDGLSKHQVVIPKGTTLQPGEFKQFYVDALAVDGGKGFGLGAADEVHLFDAKGNEVDHTDWKSHQIQSLGRIPDGTGEFRGTGKPTPGGPNIEKVVWAEKEWPFDPQEIVDLDLGADFRAEDTSGIDFDEDGNAWVVNNTTGTLYKLVYDDASRTYSVDGKWQLRYKDGNGAPDAEGVTVGTDGALYVATERDGDKPKVSRPSVLRYDRPTKSSGDIKATHEWNLASAFTQLIGYNGGLEAISYIPELDAYAVGVETTGEVLFVKLNSDESFVEVHDRYKAPFEQVMALDYNNESKELRVVCDEKCEGASIALKYDGSKFVEVSGAEKRPQGMKQNFANEGFASYTKLGECSDAGKQTAATRFLWSDDGFSDGKTSMRAASFETTQTCKPPATVPATTTSGSTIATAPATTVVVPATTVTTTPTVTVTDPAKTLTITTTPTTFTTTPTVTATQTTVPTTTAAAVTEVATETAKAVTTTPTVTATQTTVPTETADPSTVTEKATAKTVTVVPTVTETATTIPTHTAAPVTVTETVTAQPVTKTAEPVTETATVTEKVTTTPTVTEKVTTAPTHTAAPVTVTETMTALPVTKTAEPVTETATVTEKVTTTPTVTEKVTTTPTHTAAPVTVTETMTAQPVTQTAKPVTETVAGGTETVTTTPTLTTVGKPVTETATAPAVINTVTPKSTTERVAPALTGIVAGETRVIYRVPAAEGAVIEVKDLPAGLQFDAEKHLIAGKVEKPGVYEATIVTTLDGATTVEQLKIVAAPSTGSNNAAPGATTTVTTAASPATVTSVTTVPQAAGSSLDGKCVAAIAGWLIPLAALVPLGLATQIELPLPPELTEAIRPLQEQAAQLLPQVDPQVQMATGGLAAAALGIVAIASILNACTGGEGSSVGSSK